jgi:hypothetical protein
MTSPDPEVAAVVETIRAADPSGAISGNVFRNAFDYLYDGQRTGRYRPDQLSKTEKTHCGSLVEIYFRRALDGVIGDGEALDFSIADLDVDCKYSFTLGAWMLPPECFGKLLLVAHADDVAGHWSLGVVRARADYLRGGANRDAKTGLNTLGRQAIQWIFERAELPANALLALPPSDVDAIFRPTSGQKRVNELFRRAQLIPISRMVVATVAQQDDYMKRVRYNGGARSALQAEGFLIPGGDYDAHRQVALDLGAPDVAAGEFVSFRVVEASAGASQAIELEGARWRIAEPDEPSTRPAPKLPSTRRP